MGLDFSPRFAGTDEEKEEQRQVLIKQVQLAKRLNVPLWVNCLSTHSYTANPVTVGPLEFYISFPELLFKIHSFCVFKCLACMYVAVPRVWYPQNLERTLDLLILELHTVVSHHVGAGEQMQVLSKRKFVLFCLPNTPQS